MTKDELKHMIANLHTNPVIQEVLTASVDAAPEVNEDLRTFIAQTLERQAAFFDAVAEILVEDIPEEDQFAPLNKDLQQKLAPVLDQQETLLTELEQGMTKANDTPSLSKEENTAVSAIQQELQKESAAVSQPLATTS